MTFFMKKCHYMFATRAKSKILQTTTWNILSHYATNNIQNHVFTNKLHGQHTNSGLYDGRFKLKTSPYTRLEFHILI